MTPPEAPMDNTIRRYTCAWPGVMVPHSSNGDYLKVSELAAGLPALRAARNSLFIADAHANRQAIAFLTSLIEVLSHE